MRKPLMRLTSCPFLGYVRCASRGHAGTVSDGKSIKIPANAILGANYWVNGTFFFFATESSVLYRLSVRFAGDTSLPSISRWKTASHAGAPVSANFLASPALSVFRLPPDQRRIFRPDTPAPSKFAPNARRGFTRVASQNGSRAFCAPPSPSPVPPPSMTILTFNPFLREGALPRLTRRFRVFSLSVFFQ